jgi:rRNA maturation endonuclease Nob1
MAQGIKNTSKWKKVLKTKCNGCNKYFKFKNSQQYKIKPLCSSCQKDLEILKNRRRENDTD